MGLTIHYQGQFKEGASLSNMIDEVKDIAEVHNWKYHIFETEFPENSFSNPAIPKEVYGICFTPENCETVSLTFLSNGKMCAVYNILEINNTGADWEKEFMYYLFTKTQFAGIETHLLIVHLFKYLNKKYFADLKVTDEGGYWETEDENVLQQSFNRYNEIFAHVTNALENIPKLKGESIEEYFKRMLSDYKSKK